MALDLDLGRALVRRAFEQARLSGKVADWRVMTTAVLKNRLLAETRGSFNERDWGVDSIFDFASLFPDVVTLERSGPHALVKLTESVEQTAAVPSVGGRLRSDLWSAMFDYRLRRPYVWRPAKGHAEALARDESSNDPVMPTLTEDELDSWRREFGNQHRGELGTDDLSRLDAWLEGRLPTNFLPGQLQRAWNLELRTRGSRRLRDWFAAAAIPVPVDLFEVPSAPQLTPEASGLRQLIHACVDRMTDEELKALSIPAGVVLRVLDGRNPRR